MRNKGMFLALFLVAFFFIRCGADHAPTAAKISAAAEQIRSEIVKPQEKNDQRLDTLLTRMEPLAAMDSVLALFLKDTLVAWGKTSSQGIAIQSKNGIRGGIFLDTDDMPDNTGFSGSKRNDSIDRIPLCLKPGRLQQKRSFSIRPIMKDSTGPISLSRITMTVFPPRGIPDRRFPGIPRSPLTTVTPASTIRAIISLHCTSN